MRFLRSCWGFALPLVLLILAGPMLLLAGVSVQLIYVIVNGGTVIVMTGTVLYIIFYDSRRRWPKLRVGQRLTKFMSMQG